MWVSPGYQIQQGPAQPELQPRVPLQLPVHHREGATRGARAERRWGAGGALVQIPGFLSLQHNGPKDSLSREF